MTPRIIAISCSVLALTAGVARAADWGSKVPSEINITDPYLKQWNALTYDKAPPALEPGKDYGMAEDGTFRAPRATPLGESPAFPGQLEAWDDNSYSHNVEEIAFYPHISSPWHAWPDVADFDGKRYMYVHDRDYMRVLDITDPAKAKVVYSKGGVWGPEGSSEDWDAKTVQDYFGGITIAWSAKLQKNVVVASYEIGRFGILDNKRTQPDIVASLRNYNSLKGFKVYEMNGPLPDDWKLIATRTTDTKNPDAPIGKQQGSGSLDAPAWFGGKYMYLSAAPDDSYALTEYPDYLHSPGYQVWDMSDPANPVFVSQVTVPGQVVGDKASEDAYLMNPRAGNRTSWMGSRMPPFLPTPVEKGGKIAFGAMGGLGLYTFDLSNPDKPEIKGHVATAPSFAGTEFDNVDTSQYARTGYVLANGYPMNSNCYEPYKDVLVIDAKDVAAPKVVATLPRPTPPKEAKFSDFCQRKGSFGPKRSGTTHQPGHGHDGIVPYAFYNAGLQIFDVKDPAQPKISGYFVPRFPTTSEMPDYTFDNASFAVFTEYDRNIIWLFSVNGVHALKTPLLGEPRMGMSDQLWPPRD
ncbi:hypothetical protein J1C56_17625 [Aminobacter anthyllidis]|uniref:LVIVD repeat-containing protein n=1 Tax=Aminobacter anthyllidis TaxID=1035067 RepID=A0A9X1D719_9HYPH|nr:hypothetical protein [Aminobacter anthyllidis]MBT1157414.1 hypothetical protein [Aminobacter anthyllidis]